MAESPYLVALALAEQEGRRILPLTGKSRPAALLPADPGEEGRTLALELLLRLWQLATLVSRAWRISIARYEPVSFIAWP